MSLVNLQSNRAALLARSAGIAILATALFAGCESDRTTELRAPSGQPSAGKGGGGGGTGGTGGGTLTVTAATPAAATQDTTLDVSVSGTGFTTGARAVWSLNGDTTLVHVKSTKRVSDTQLVASLIIPANAPTASYDIQVMLVGGKKGVGAELFTVTLKDPTAQFLFPLDDAALGLRSDHIATYTQGNVSVYGDGICGIHSKIFANETGNGDAIMGTNDSKYANRRCPDYPRSMRLVLRDDAGNIVKQFSTGVYLNLYRIEDDTDLIAPGTTVLRSFTIANTQGGCDVWWKPLLGDQVTPTGADKVNVTRTSASTWLVQTQPYPNDKAYCMADGHLYHVPVSFTVVSDRPLP